MKPTKVAAVTAVAAMAVTAAACGSSGTSSTGSAAPSHITVWRMGSSTPAQVTWMKGVVTQFHQKFPQYAKTTVTVKFVPWTVRTTQWENALSSGKGGPDITELGNTDTPTVASQGMLANIAGDVNAWPSKSELVSGMLANDTQSGKVYAVPWFGGVRGIWYRKDQFAAAGISSPPATWAQLVSDAKALMKKFPGTYGLGAPSNYTNAIVSFIWGAGGQVAVQQNGQWKAELNSPQSEAGIKFYADLYLKEHVSPAKYIGQTELGAPGATSGGSDEDFAKGTLDMYVDGPWAKASLEAVSKKYESQWASFPIPSQQGPNPAPAFAGGSDLGVWAKSPNQKAAWALVTVMDSPSNATTFANASGFFPEFTSALSGGGYSNNPILAGFAKAAAYTQISPLNSKNWATADATDAIIPTMMKALMKGAPFTATVNKANADLEKVLNTGSM